MDFIVGARPIEAGTDLNFVGLLTGLVIMPHRAPLGFSRCVLQCLEYMTVDTTGTDIIATAFNRELRQLVLYGPASPETFETVLRTIAYTNLAPDINVASIEVDVHDGINNTVERIAVVQGMMRKKRDTAVAVEEPLTQHHHRRHVLSVSDSSKEREELHGSLTVYWPLVVIALSSLGIFIAVLVVWGMRPKQVPNTLA